MKTYNVLSIFIVALCFVSPVNGDEAAPADCVDCELKAIVENLNLIQGALETFGPDSSEQREFIKENIGSVKKSIKNLQKVRFEQNETILTDLQDLKISLANLAEIAGWDYSMAWGIKTDTETIESNLLEVRKYLGLVESSDSPKIATEWKEGKLASNDYVSRVISALAQYGLLVKTFEFKNMGTLESKKEKSIDDFRLVFAGGHLKIYVDLENEIGWNEAEDVLCHLKDLLKLYAFRGLTPDEIDYRYHNREDHVEYDAQGKLTIGEKRVAEKRKVARQSRGKN